MTAQGVIKINEDKLIKLSRKGDKKASGELIKLYYKDVFRYVYAQTRNNELSKDLTQEIFIAMLKSIERFDSSKASFKTWIYKIAAYKIIDAYRSTYYKYVTLSDEQDFEKVDETIDIELSFETKEATEEVLEFVNKLSVSLQEVFRLKIFADMTFIEIAKILDISESTVKTRYYSCIKKIKDSLGEEKNDR